MALPLIYTSKARRDMETLYEFISSDNPARAETYVSGIYRSCMDLRDMPYMGVARDDIRPGLRLFVQGRRVVVAYVVMDTAIKILRVISGWQDYAALITDDVSL